MKTIITILILLPSIVFAATTGLSESKFDIDGVPSQVVTKELWVTNTDTIDQKYELKADDPFFEQNVSILPQKFSLASQDFQKVVIRFRVPLESQRIYLSLLSFDSNQSSQLQVGNGIKIPVQFNVKKVAGLSSVALAKGEALAKAGQFDFLNTVVWAVNIILIGFIIWYLKKRRFAV